MNPTLPSPAIVAILAGGKAKRFGGQDKGEIFINGKRLIDIIYERLEPQSSEVLLSGTQDYGLGLDVVADADHAPGGPVGGVYSIWKILEGRAIEGFFTVAVDGPNFPDDLITSLYSKTSSTIAADEKGRHPTYSWWRMVDLAKIWKNLDGSKSLSLNYLADSAGARPVTWSGNKTFININCAADLKQFVKGA